MIINNSHIPGPSYFRNRLSEMFTCKQVSNALSREDYENLPPMRRFFLKLHVRLCVFCGRFNRQVMDSQDMCRSFKAHEDVLSPYRPKMDEAQKESLKQLMAQKAVDEEHSGKQTS